MNLRFNCVCALMCASSAGSMGATLRVPQDYATIQAAMDAAASRDVIEVAAGTYQENLTNFREVTIRGASPLGSTVLKNASFGNVAAVGGVDVTFERLEFRPLDSTSNNLQPNAVYATSGMLTLRECRFRDFAKWNSIIRCSRGRIEDCEFINNGYRGGSTLGAAVSCISGVTEINRCVFRGNKGNGGGVLGCDRATIRVSNSLFDKNQANQGGVAWVVGTGKVEILNCTLVGNDAFNGSIASIPGSDSIVLRNCIVWGNTGTGLFYKSTLPPASPVITYSVVQGGYIGEGNIDADPQFVDAANRDYRLKPTSPCIDAGNNGASTWIGDRDAALAPRWVDRVNTADTGVGPGPVIDMGAFEHQPQNCSADQNQSGRVDVGDLFKFIDDWFAQLGQSCN